MQELHLVSPIPPSVNHYLAYRAIMKGKKPLAVSYKTPEAVKYKKKFAEYVKREVLAQKWDNPLDKYQHFYVDATFYFPRTDMDSNNYWKCMLDAITDTQLIWCDDNVVCERTQGIYYDIGNPRVELVIRKTDYIGVFDDAPQLEAFVSNYCIECRYGTRNCSVLQNAKEGRIQTEFADGVCKKYIKRKGTKGGNRNG